MFQSILLIVFAGILVWFLVRMFPRREKSGIGTYKVSAEANPFHAVSVYPSPAGCEAVQAIKGKRFLPNEAPQLPLAACTAEECHCAYHHHVDRRTGSGDRRDIGIDSFFSLNDANRKRRQSAGRREIDKTSDLPLA